jgi:hypothetical protein
MTNEYGIREVPIMRNRKKPVGYVAHHWTCGWSTNIHVSDTDYNNPKLVLRTGFDKANAELREHLRTCDLSLSNRTRTTSPDGITRRPISEPPPV